MEQSRLTFLDIAKGITVLWVVWMHMEMPMKIWASFQMPLFFFLSGSLFKMPNSDGWTWVKKKAKVLLMPMLTFMCISLIIICMREEVVTGSNLVWKIHTLFVTSLVWFLEAMFLFVCFHYGVTRWFNWKYVGIVFAALLYPLGFFLSARYTEDFLPCMAVAPTLTFWIYFELGCLWGRRYHVFLDDDKKTLKHRILYGIAAVICVIVVCTPILNELFFRRIMGGANYLLPIYSIPFNLAMTYLVLLFSRYVEKRKISRIWHFYGVNSLVVYLAHWPIYMNWVNPMIKEGMNPYLGFCVVIVSVTLCIVFFNKCCPFLIGKTKQCKA
jgi:fucose 4-O-acetylase-like acetyltransferase